ncbi:MAG: methyltransferase domain-containing protein, partial [Nanoarchaeota archaeon]|nr:methyltransferase domain-containing protein [Nanoarchaeota archaeon]
MRERIELQKEQNRVFFDRATWFYETWLVKKINRIFQRRLLKEIQIKKNSKILDAGCGTGTFLETLDKNCENVKLEGIDISVKMVEVSRKRLGKKVCLSVESVE